MKIYKFTILLILMLLIENNATAARLHQEKEYQNVWCTKNHGIQEYMLYDKSRVDCLTQNYAIEFDFASKWGESIGQSLYYAAVTKRSPGVVLIMEDPQRDQKYLNRLNTVAQKHGIKVWTIYPSALKQEICTNE